MALGLLSRVSGDFGTSPFFEQLSGKSLLTLHIRTWGAKIKAQWPVDKLIPG
jgi:hypothetical protein